MELFEFAGKFGTESSCRQRFKEIRDKEGVTCKKCNGREHYWLKSKEMYQCKKCSFRTSLRSGTVMEASKLPFQYWFAALYLMTNSKKDISAYQMQRELGHKRYEPIWAMMHKLRKAMGRRDSLYLLTGEVEVDEGFFETLVPEDQKSRKRKRGRGSQKQTMAMVFAESRKVESAGKHRTNRACGYFKMVVCPGFTAETVREILENTLTKNAIKITDGHRVYTKLAKMVESVHPEKIPSNQAHIKLPWVHTAIGNLKRILNGIFHHVKPEYLQNYIDQFCYKLNRRNFKCLFDRGLLAMTLT